jgi:hypothetical protein
MKKRFGGGKLHLASVERACHCLVDCKFWNILRQETQSPGPETLNPKLQTLKDSAGHGSEASRCRRVPAYCRGLLPVLVQWYEYGGTGTGTGHTQYRYIAMKALAMRLSFLPMGQKEMYNELYRAGETLLVLATSRQEAAHQFLNLGVI